MSSKIGILDDFNSSDDDIDVNDIDNEETDIDFDNDETDIENDEQNDKNDDDDIEQKKKILNESDTENEEYNDYNDPSQSVEYNKNQNPLIKQFMKNLFKISQKKDAEISDLFDSEELSEFNAKKKYDVKHSKFGYDEYGLLIRENKFNKQNDFYG